MPTPDRLREEAVRWTFFLGIVAAWQVASRNMPTYLVPPPLSVAQDLLHLLGNSGLRHQVLVTLFLPRGIAGLLRRREKAIPPTPPSPAPAASEAAS